VGADELARASPGESVARTLVHMLGYIEVGAGELTHAAVERVRQNREDAIVLGLGAGLAVAVGLLIVVLLS
jgi:hypothetical protein